MSDHSLGLALRFPGCGHMALGVGWRIAPSKPFCWVLPPGGPDLDHQVGWAALPALVGISELGQLGAGSAVFEGCSIRGPFLAKLGPELGG